MDSGMGRLHFNFYILDFVEKIHEAMDKGEYVRGIFLDLTNMNIIKSIRGMPLLW